MREPRSKEAEERKIQSERGGAKHEGSYAIGSDEVTQEVIGISTQSQATSLERRLDFRGIKKTARGFLRIGGRNLPCANLCLNTCQVSLSVSTRSQRDA